MTPQHAALRMRALLKGMRPRHPTIDSVALLIGLRRAVERAIDADIRKINKAKSKRARP